MVWFGGDEGVSGMDVSDPMASLGACPALGAGMTFEGVCLSPAVFPHLIRNQGACLNSPLSRFAGEG